MHNLFDFFKTRTTYDKNVCIKSKEKSQKIEKFTNAINL